MNLKIIFSHPWLLLLLIPAVALVMLPHLKLSKKYRRTRNRIISLVLQCFIMVLSISVLAGTQFAYSETNYENELVILVDVSDSSNSETVMNSKNIFVQNILRESGGEYRTGIIKFANGYEYAAEMGYNTNDLYRDYITSKNPDRDGTDIASALEFAKTLINNPKTAKVVILSDGFETDGEALAAVMSIVLGGTKVDTVSFPGTELGREIQINSVKFPDHNIMLEEEFTMNLEIESSFVGEAVISVIDNGESVIEEKKVLQKDLNSIPIKYKFTTTGSHEIRFIITNSADKVIQNNTLCTYYYLEVVDRLLIIQRDEEAVLLKDMLDRSVTLSDNGKIDVTNFGESNCPDTLEELAKYDQVILMNIANSDMPEGFVDILTQYVGEFGGGLLTVGGNKDINDDENIVEYSNNTYGYQDMKDTDYSKLLPVEAVERYTPPVSVMIVVDVSTSMDATTPSGETVMALARKGAINSLKHLNDRDYVGVISFSEKAITICDLTPASRRAEIEQRISTMSTEGGTYYGLGLGLAVSKLSVFDKTRKKHIIFITDGKPSDSGYKTESNGYITYIKHALAAGMSMSAIDISSKGDSAEQALREIGEIEGFGSENVHLGKDVAKLDQTIGAILAVDDVTSFMDVEFVPEIYGINKVTEGIPYLPKLGGYYGVESKPDAVVSVMGDYAPLYAQWNFGKGKVGSFMCDLDGTWSGEFFIADSEGKRYGEQFILNVIRELYPQRMIHYTEIKATIELNNFRPRVQVDNEHGLPDGEYYEVNVSRLNEYYGETDAKQTIRMVEAGKLFKCNYNVREPGVYIVDILKKNAKGDIIDKLNTHTIFSYSAEYNEFLNPKDGEKFIAELASRGGGDVVTEPGEVLSAVTEIPQTYDPRIPFIIAVILLFLLDVAVRKFKFKWPWEIIRDRKEKKRIAEIKARRAGINKQ